MGLRVHVLSQRDINDFKCYKSIGEAFENNDFEYIVIANETYRHYETFMELNRLGYSGKILIEKPIFMAPCSIPQLDLENVFVAYNMRFHPIIQKIHEFLPGKPIYSIQIYVGQYLPLWRPGTDYVKSYSASKARGGGVLRDLSHELDYMNWLCGSWKRVATIGGKFSNLKINSEDVFVLLLETENCPAVSVQLNYLDRKTHREIIVNMKDHTMKADLILNTLEIDENIQEFKIDRNMTYAVQHDAILNGDTRTTCTMKQAMDILDLIKAAEMASKKQKWITKSDLGLML
jgi:predicted dehydrogenase